MLPRKKHIVKIGTARDVLRFGVSSGPDLKKGFISQSYDTTSPTNPFELSKILIAFASDSEQGRRLTYDLELDI
jgi:hypothetical protein